MIRDIFNKGRKMKNNKKMNAKEIIKKIDESIKINEVDISIDSHNNRVGIMYLSDLPNTIRTKAQKFADDYDGYVAGDTFTFKSYSLASIFAELMQSAIRDFGGGSRIIKK
jgi:hypothetical protein